MLQTLVRDIPRITNQLTKIKMNREIKFRAWVVNSAIKEMIYSDTIELNSACAHSLCHKVGFITNRPDEYENQIEQWQKDIIWMQFTGLQDKNGVDIYEGDICKTTYYNYVEKNSVFTQIVVFENGIFAVKSINKETSKIDEWRSFSSLHQFFMPTPNKIEVIGNIFDNPNLLQ